jgi:hypothetical protein
MESVRSFTASNAHVIHLDHSLVRFHGEMLRWNGSRLFTQSGGRAASA